MTRLNKLKGLNVKYTTGEFGRIVGVEADKLVAQNSQLNRAGGEWYQMEQQWAQALKETPPKNVSVKIEPVYYDGSLRPSRFEIEYSIENQGTFIRTIKNSAGGS